MDLLRVSLAASIATSAMVHGGCKSKATTAPNPVGAAAATGSAAPLLPSSPRAVTATRDVGFSTIVVAGNNGITELRFDGSLVKQWSSTPAKQPRFDREHRRLLFLTANNHEVRELHFADGKERVLATLPPSVVLCAETPSYPKGKVFSLDELKVHADYDFVIARDGNAACLSLKDRNLNMLNIELIVRIELTKGVVETTIFTPECKGVKPVATCELDSPRQVTAPASTAWPYDFVDGNVVQRKGNNTVVHHRLGTDDFGIDGAGPSMSARWYPIRGNMQQGDYIHTSLLLLDRSNGAIWPIVVGPTHPLSSQEILAITDVTTVDVVGESTIRWLTSPVPSGTSPAQPAAEVLIVDQLLVHPGQPALELGGDVAQ